MNKMMPLDAAGAAKAAVQPSKINNLLEEPVTAAAAKDVTNKKCSSTAENIGQKTKQKRTFGICVCQSFG